MEVSKDKVIKVIDDYKEYLGALVYFEGLKDDKIKGYAKKLESNLDIAELIISNMYELNKHFARDYKGFDFEETNDTEYDLIVPTFKDLIEGDSNVVVKVYNLDYEWTEDTPDMDRYSGDMVTEKLVKFDIKDGRVSASTSSF